MPEVIGEAFVAIRPQTAGFEQDLTSKLGGVVKTVGAALGGLLIASKGIDFLSGAFADSQEAFKIAAQTDAVIKSTGKSANVTAGQIDKLTGSLQEKNAIDDDVIRSGANMLLTFTKIRNEVGVGNDIFNQATAILLDMSKALGTDVAGSAIQLGKALNDPIGGVTALRRVGVQLTDAQEAQIKAFVETGDVMSAQKVILAELTTEFGGSAAAQVTAADKASVAFGNLKEAIGRGITPAVTGFANASLALIDVVGDIVDAIGGFVAAAPALIITIGLIGAAITGSVGLGVFAAVTAVAAALIGIADAIGLIGDNTDGIKDTSDRIGQLAKAINSTDPTAATRKFHEFTVATDGVGKRLDPANRELGNFIRLANESPAAAQKIIEGMKAAGANTGTFERALASAVSQQRKVIEATDDAADANKALLATLEDVNDQVLATAGGQLGYEAAVRSAEKAQRDLDTAIKEHGETSDEAQDANLRLRQSQLQVAQSANDLDKATFEMNAQFAATPGKIQEEINKLEEAKQRHPEVAASYDPIIQRLRDLLKAQQDLETEKQLTIRLRLGADENVQAVLRGLGVDLPIPALATGGPVGAGTFLVGERGNGGELLTLEPGSRGRVTNAQQTEQILDAPTAGGDTFVFNYAAPPLTPVQHSIEVYRARRLAQWAHS